MIPIIIPSYEPDNSLIALLNTLDEQGVGPIIVVNDGSGSNYDEIFNRANDIIKKSNGTLLIHDINKGKGRALKTAFDYVLEHHLNAIGVVTADSDGQHTVGCIKKIIEGLNSNKDSLVLGVRSFDGDGIPWKSRFGNNLTEKVFAYVAGIHVSDTQTGLRGIPRTFMEQLINVPGERFEFETQMLLESSGHYPIKEIKVETIYDSEEDHQTHFNPVVDSIRIYKILCKKFIKYMLSSFSSSIIDIGLFSVFCYFLKGNAKFYIAIATILARIISAIYNYLVNYKIVFKSKENVKRSGIKYMTLAIVQMSLSAILATCGVALLSSIPNVIIKIVVDTFLFFVSYHVQQKYVFQKIKHK